MTLTEAKHLERMVFVLGEIARGRSDCGRPLAAETSRQMAREVLGHCNRTWPGTTGPLGRVGRTVLSFPGDPDIELK